MSNNEDTEMWRRYREDGQKRKLENRQNSLKILQENGISWWLLNDDTGHYRVGAFDYWPSTGKFYNQKTGEKGRGVFNLIKKLK